jgi:hypothetical protein
MGRCLAALTFGGGASQSRGRVGGRRSASAAQGSRRDAATAAVKRSLPPARTSALAPTCRTYRFKGLAVAMTADAVDESCRKH